MKKFILTASETVIFLLFIYMTVLNYLSNTNCEFAFYTGNAIISVKTFIVITAAYLLGGISVCAYTAVIGGNYKEQIKTYSKRNEKLMLKSETDSDDKEALKRKIATLEKALDNALNAQKK